MGVVAEGIGAAMYKKDPKGFLTSDFSDDLTPDMLKGAADWAASMYDTSEEAFALYKAVGDIPSFYTQSRETNYGIRATAVAARSRAQQAAASGAAASQAPSSAQTASTNAEVAQARKRNTLYGE